MENGQFESPDTMLGDIASMPLDNDKLMAIFVRLAQLDKGQIYLIEQIKQLEVRQDRADLVRQRIDKLEWAQGQHERSVRPWRHLIFSVLASCVTAALTFLLLHRG